MSAAHTKLSIPKVSPFLYLTSEREIVEKFGDPRGVTNALSGNKGEQVPGPLEIFEAEETKDC